ncbi:hypothetical protein WA026_010081 [Henosepilachna vigintioctopunctata]|uniref:Uncharacterized protein n=1 Tax=Henosepilachna vigintioctopunctata TaxID=420089 RepID=A0AAW1UI57_9CUCU
MEKTDQRRTEERTTTEAKKPIHPSVRPIYGNINYAGAVKNTITNTPNHNVQQNTSTENTNNISNTHELQDFQTLINEIKILNQLGNLRELIQIVRELNQKLSTTNNTFEKIIILQELTTKYNV